MINEMVSYLKNLEAEYTRLTEAAQKVNVGHDYHANSAQRNIKGSLESLQRSIKEALDAINDIELITDSIACKYDEIHEAAVY